MATLNVYSEVKGIVTNDEKTSLKVVALFAAFGSLAAIKAEFLKGAKDWPRNEKGEHVGEKAARETVSGKLYNSFRACAGRYVDVALGRPLTDAEKAARTEKAAQEKAKAAQDAVTEGEKVKQAQAAQLKAAQDAMLTFDNCLAFLTACAKGNDTATDALKTFKAAIESARPLAGQKPARVKKQKATA